MFAAAAGRLGATEWIEHLNLVQTLAFLGMIVGLALGQSRFSPRLAAYFALAYGLFAVPWQLGITVGFISEETLWNDRLVSMAGRLLSVLGQMFQREPVQDPLFFLFTMACLFWALSAHAGYTLTRYAHPWRAALPAGLTLLIIHLTDPYETSRIWYLALYLFLLLLFLARLTYVRRYIHWQQTRAHLPPLIVLDFAYFILGASVVLISLAWATPVLAGTIPTVRDAWLRTVRPWWNATHERMDDVLASLRRPVVATVAGYYGESLTLGRGGELSDSVILTVQSSSPGGEGRGVRYYWRARVYDDYADGQWNSVIFSRTQSLPPTGLGLTFPELEGRRTLTFTFTSAAPLVTFYAASQPRWISQYATADLASNPDGTVDLAALHAPQHLRAGQTYQARSSLSSVTITQLREAGTDYPRWITDRYLQLPPTMPPRVLDLAREIAAEYDNPYDIAMAVTRYLRDNIAYVETVPLPPTDQEPLDWFLFDLREGFCSYYASAEVVMLRSLGVPARLAAGFARGEREPGTSTFLVRQRDAHSWPEAYFPNMGWVEFEPTVSQPAITRPLGEPRDSTADSAGPEDLGRFGRDRWENRLDELLALDESQLDPGVEIPQTSPAPVILRVAILALGAVLIALGWRRRRQRGMPPLPVLLENNLRRFDIKPPAFLRRWVLRATLPPLMCAYQELNYALIRLGVSPALAETPTERAVALARRLPAAAEPARQLVAEYHATAYSPDLGDLDVARQAARTIRNLSWRVVLRKLFISEEEEE